ncbi:MAG: heme A synthase [Terriglobia bacterium]
MTSAHSAARPRLGLHRFARVTAGATFLLIIAGALVTSNDAGLAVPDWPLSYGTWMPPMVGGIFYEHGHRMVAATVGLLTLILALWLWAREPRRWVRRLGLVALGAVVLQGVVGGITVLWLLPPPVSIGHASLAQIFLCLTVSLALFTGPHWQESRTGREDTGRPSLLFLCALATLAIFGQLVLGAAFRHRFIGVWPHVVGAAVVTVCLAWAIRRVWRQHRQDPWLHRPAMTLGALLAGQLLLGIATYLGRLATVDAAQPLILMVVLSVAHVAVGALTLATSVVLTLQAHRRLLRPGEASSWATASQDVTA